MNIDGYVKKYSDLADAIKEASRLEAGDECGWSYSPKQCGEDRWLIVIRDEERHFVGYWTEER